MGNIGKMFNAYRENKIERQNVFDGFVTSPKDGRKGFNYRHEYFRYGVVFDINPMYQNYEMTKQDIQDLGLQGEIIFNKKADCAHYKPTTFEELATCLSYTKYTSFIKYLYGENAETNFINLIDTFARCNLQEIPDKQTISEYSAQIYSIIKEDKGPKFYAERMNMYEARIIEAYNRIQEFQGLYSGALPTQEDYNFVRSGEEVANEEMQQPAEAMSVEEIVKQVLANREKNYASREVSSETESSASESELVF